jgi:hypothetical protein
MGMSNIISTLIGLGENTLGWFLNCFTTKWKDRPQLCFIMVATPESELLEKELRTKTSLSENGIKIYNVGTKPFILEQFSLYHKGIILVDCPMDDGGKVILPSQGVVYTLDEQESNALQYHCDRDPFEVCDVVAYSVDKQKLRASLEIPLFALRARMRTSDDIVHSTNA